MTPVGTAPMSCPEARGLVSERLDGASVGPAVEQHLRGCPACARFEDSALTVRRALRLPSIAGAWTDVDHPDDELTAAVMASIAELDDTSPADGALTSELRSGATDSGSWPADRDEHVAEADLADLVAGDLHRHHPSRTHEHRGRRRIRAALAGVAVFALCVAIGFASVHWQGGVMPAVANDRSTVVSQGQVLVQSLQAGVTLFEIGPTGATTHQAGGTAAVRRSRGRVPAAVGRHHHQRGRRERRGRLAGRHRSRVGAGPRAVRPRRLVGARGGRPRRCLRARSRSGRGHRRRRPPRLAGDDHRRPGQRAARRPAHRHHLATARRLRHRDALARPRHRACRCASR